MKEPKRKSPFLGAATALATPFCGESVDFSALGYMIDYQIREGIDALVLCGTTGEAATLTEREYESVISFSAARIGGRVPYIVGCGSPSTAQASARAALAAKHGADAVLLVTPYYNRGTREGLCRHFHTVADGAKCPLILYHVPARTGVRLAAEDICRIAEHPLITGIKEASGDMTLFADIAAAIGDTLTLYSGNDALILPALSLGGGGVISVISNLFPRETAAICHLYFEGKTEESTAHHLRLVPLMSLLFKETSPAPLKCALAHKGLCREDLRLPLYPVEDDLRARLQTAIDQYETES